MRLVSWNCKGALSRKLPLVQEAEPDILVVPEAEMAPAFNNTLGARPINSVHWVGERQRKGLAVLSFGDYRLDVHPDHDPRHRYILPVEISGPEFCLLFAVWTVPGAERGYYIEPLVEALATYDHVLGQPNLIWAGDFNQNVVFDSGTSTYRFDDFLEQLAIHDIHSVCHTLRCCAHGCESEPTFYLHHDPTKSHQIDYVGSFCRAALVFWFG